MRLTPPVLSKRVPGFSRMALKERRVASSNAFGELIEFARHGRGQAAVHRFLQATRNAAPKEVRRCRGAGWRSTRRHSARSWAGDMVASRAS